VTISDEPIAESLEPAPEPSREPEPEPERRRRLRRVHVIALVLASLLFAGALAFMLASTSDRDSAAADRRREQHQLQVQRAATAHAQESLTATRSDATAAASAFGDMLGPAQSLVDLSTQEVDAARATQQIGATDDPPIDDYNASIKHDNDLTVQFSAASGAVHQKIDSITRNLSGQNGRLASQHRPR